MSETMDPPAYPILALKLKEAAKALAVSESQLRRLVAAGKIKPKREGKSVTYPVKVLSDYLERDG